jgi:HPt (histidine-containing phosphotransfer) domain-containing protein
MSENIYENRIATLERKIEELERQQTELRLFQRELVKRDYILVIATVLSILGAGGYLGYQNTLLVGQIDRRVEQIEKRLDQTERSFNARFDQMEKRFEDLKQVVISDRQIREKK